jgi:hypothetical protein
MRKAGVWLLSIAGVVGLLTALSFEGHGGGVSRLQPEGPIVDGPMTYRVGIPDAWLEWESSLNGRIADVHFVRWSFAILLVSVCALCSAVLLRWRTPKPVRDGS